MIEFNRLDLEYNHFKNLFIPKINSIIQSGYYILGNELSNFERNFSSRIGRTFCVGVDNGLNAIILGIKSLDYPIDSEIIVQANTYIATILGIVHNNLKPILVEPDDTYNMDPSLIERAINKNTRAILVTHLYGKPTKMSRIVDIAKKNNIDILEDCAQSHFASNEDGMTGTFGVMSFYSFYPTKPIGCMGDGGAILLDDSKYYDKLRMLRNYGSSIKYHHSILGYNSRLDELQAAILNVKLNLYPQVYEERTRLALNYLSRIINKNIILPINDDSETNSWHLFVIRTSHRKQLIDYLTKNSIGYGIHYPIPPHLSEALSFLDIKKGRYPITELFSDQVISLPLYYGLKDNEQDFIIETINRFEPHEED